MLIYISTCHEAAQTVILNPQKYTNMHLHLQAPLNMEFAPTSCERF